MTVARRLPLGLLLVVLACDSNSAVKPQGPGVLRGTLVSPNGPEGAGVFQLTGTGFGAVTPVLLNTFVSDSGVPVQVTVVIPGAGDLQFDVAVDELTRPPAVTVVEVAAPSNAIRTSLNGYKMKWTKVTASAAGVR